MTCTNTTSTIFGCKSRFLCQISRFQSQYNVHEYRHRCIIFLKQYITEGETPPPPPTGFVQYITDTLDGKKLYHFITIILCINCSTMNHTLVKKNMWLRIKEYQEIKDKRQNVVFIEYPALESIRSITRQGSELCRTIWILIICIWQHSWQKAFFQYFFFSLSSWYMISSAKHKFPYCEPENRHWKKPALMLCS